MTRSQSKDARVLVTKAEKMLVVAVLAIEDARATIIPAIPVREWAALFAHYYRWLAAVRREREAAKKRRGK